ncbi:unnamed protein product [Cuscuta epithymum]|uniref:Uncharacterized protein n=1 Tax=Cuscuta epithymum TaxID=186058 RepID=A0AAV0F0X0_9ASTE|nr:unnamed protein product [Cuscuta epithymum]
MSKNISWRPYQFISLHTTYPTLLKGLRHSYKPLIRTPKDKGEGESHTTNKAKERTSCPQGKFPVSKVACLIHISSYTNPNRACEVPKEISQEEESVKVRFAANGVGEDFQIVERKHSLA